MLPFPFFVGSFPLWNDLKKNNPGERKKSKAQDDLKSSAKTKITDKISNDLSKKANWMIFQILSL